jgi:hypothetical protein
MHMHGVHGAVGAAAAVARLRELDAEVTARALGVAAGLTLGTSWRTALGGATVRNAYAGVAGANGWLAADPRSPASRAAGHAEEIFGRSAARLDAAASWTAGRALRDLPQLPGATLAVTTTRRSRPLRSPRRDVRRARDRVDPRRDLGARRHDERARLVGSLGAKFSIRIRLPRDSCWGWDDCGVGLGASDLDARVRASLGEWRSWRTRR